MERTLAAARMLTPAPGSRVLSPTLPATARRAGRQEMAWRLRGGTAISSALLLVKMSWLGSMRRLLGRVWVFTVVAAAIGLAVYGRAEEQALHQLEPLGR